jgi:hypothetical protein
MAKVPLASVAPAVTVVTPPVVEPPAPAAPQTAAVVTPAENTSANDTASASARRVAPGMAALTESPPPNDATLSDISETPTIAVDAPPPQKKTKHAVVAPAKTKPPTLGSVFGSLFSSHH